MGWWGGTDLSLGPHNLWVFGHSCVVNPHLCMAWSWLWSMSLPLWSSLTAGWSQSPLIPRLGGLGSPSKLGHHHAACRPLCTLPASTAARHHKHPLSPDPARGQTQGPSQGPLPGLRTMFAQGPCIHGCAPCPQTCAHGCLCVRVPACLCAQKGQGRVPGSALLSRLQVPLQVVRSERLGIRTHVAGTRKPRPVLPLLPMPAPSPL